MSCGWREWSRCWFGSVLNRPGFIEGNDGLEICIVRKVKNGCLCSASSALPCSAVEGVCVLFKGLTADTVECGGMVVVRRPAQGGSMSYMTMLLSVAAPPGTGQVSPSASSSRSR